MSILNNPISSMSISCNWYVSKWNKRITSADKSFFYNPLKYSLCDLNEQLHYSFFPYFKCEKAILSRCILIKMLYICNLIDSFLCSSHIVVCLKVMFYSHFPKNHSYWKLYASEMFCLVVWIWQIMVRYCLFLFHIHLNSFQYMKSNQQL